MTLLQASLKKNEKLVFHNLQNKRKKHRLKNIFGTFVRTAEIEYTFCKGVGKNWSYNLFTTTEVIH